MKANDSYGTFTSPAEVRLVRLLPGPIERIWEYLTDAEKRARWFAGGPMEPKQGGKVTLQFQNKSLAGNEAPPAGFEEIHEKGHTMNLVVTRWEPPHVLGLTFGSDGESEVIFELTPQGKQVQLVLTHRSTGGDLPYITLFAAGWHTHVSHLVALLEKAPQPSFWSQFVRVKAEYEKQLTALKA